VGHDIHAYVSRYAGETERFVYLRDEEVAYLRRSAYNPLAREIYAALNCPELDGGVSGAPGEKVVSQVDLEQALVYLRKRQAEGLEVEPEIAFVEACLSRIAAAADQVVVYFG
jgi:hypothetical protein